MGLKEDLEKILDKEIVESIFANLGEELLGRIKIDKTVEILKVLEDEQLGKNIIMECLGLLAQTTATNIRNICKIFREHGLYDLIIKNPMVLRTSSKNAEELIQLYEKENLIEELRLQPSKLYNTSYEFTLSRMNYLKEKGIPLSIDGNLNPDIFIPSAKFEKKYGINGKELKVQYGKSYQDKENNDKSQEVEESTIEEQTNNQESQKSAEGQTQTEVQDELQEPQGIEEIGQKESDYIINLKPGKDIRQVINQIEAQLERADNSWNEYESELSGLKEELIQAAKDVQIEKITELTSRIQEIQGKVEQIELGKKQLESTLEEKMQQMEVFKQSAIQKIEDVLGVSNNDR